MTSSKVVLSIGSNCNSNLVSEAAEWLVSILSDAEVSSLYRTNPIQGYGDPYVNMVIIGRTACGYEELNLQLKQYERAHGRDENARRAGCVPVDIDIVIWGDDTVRPRDFRQSFFQIGYSELTGSVVKAETDC